MQVSSKKVQKIWISLGFIPFILPVMPLFDIAIVSRPFWPGYVKGIEVTLLDLIVLAIRLSFPPSRSSIPFRFSMTFYFLAVLLSVFQALDPMAAMFYIWQLMRMYLIYAVVARACSIDERVPAALLKGMTIGLCLEAFITCWQRFILGVVQTPGTFAHQNTLGLASHLVILPLFAVFLTKRKSWEFSLGPVSGMIIAILTASRATIGLVGLGVTSIFTLSMVRQLTSRKTIVGTIGAITIAIDDGID